MIKIGDGEMSISFTSFQYLNRLIKRYHIFLYCSLNHKFLLRNILIHPQPLFLLILPPQQIKHLLFVNFQIRTPHQKFLTLSHLLKNLLQRPKEKTVSLSFSFLKWYFFLFGSPWSTFITGRVLQGRARFALVSLKKVIILVVHIACNGVSFAGASLTIDENRRVNASHWFF